MEQQAAAQQYQKQNRLADPGQYVLIVEIKKTNSSPSLLKIQIPDVRACKFTRNHRQLPTHTSHTIQISE